jgi:2-keto-4-pentenoate hydratase/2-oxohepta-3-ene-1,7-dioic acid hydratase in catechol pathway
MRLASIRRDGRDSYGQVTEAGFIDFGTLDERLPSLKAALAADAVADLARRANGAAAVPLDGARWLPPIPDADKILCVGLNYRRHAAEAGMQIPPRPSIFVRFNSSQVGHEQAIVRPALSEQFDYEGELAVVIGKPTRHISAERALEVVAGYSCFAENSVRDFQRHSNQATPGKNFVASGAFGPWMVTADEIADPNRLMLVTRLNGEEVQRESTADMIFSVAEQIAYVSAFTELLPGDVISTGTPSGVGMARQPPLWLKAGDRLEVEIENIGTLRSRVVDERQPNP